MNGKIIKDALILFLITVIAGLGLGAVYGITKAPIEKANYNIQQNAYRTVFPDADAFNDMDGFDSEKATEAAAAAGYADDTIENCVVAVDAAKFPLLPSDIIPSFSPNKLLPLKNSLCNIPAPAALY